jgi:hypothetical protein
VANRLHVIRRDGRVVAEIPLPFDGLLFSSFGVAFLSPDRIVVSVDGTSLYVLDFDGNMLGDEIPTEGPAEGIVQLADGRVVTGEWSQLRFYDAELARRPQDDIDAGTPVAIIQAASVAWDPDRVQHLVVGNAETFVDGAPYVQVAAVSAALDASTPVVTLNDDWLRTPRATYMPDEQLTAVALRRSGGAQPPEIALYDGDGTRLETIDVSGIGGVGHPGKIAYAESTSEFVVVERTQPTTLKFLTRSGGVSREVDLAPIGIERVSALTCFNPLHPSGGQFLVFDPGGRAVVTDFEGNLMAEFDYRRELGLVTVTGASAISNGPDAGAFAALELASSPTLVLFTME